MTSNSSGNVNTADDPLEAFATPYFRWLENEVFPVFVGITNILILIIGTILNSLLLHAIRKERLQIRSEKVYLLNLIVLDLLAYVFILLPSIIVAFSKTWNLSDFICTLNGDFVTACFLMTFYIQIVIFIERWMKITDPEFHAKTLGKTKVSIVTLMLFWIIFFIVGLLPLTEWSKLEFISSQHLCNINHSYNPAGMVLLFVFGMFMPSTASIIFMILIGRKRTDILKILKDLQLQVNSVNKSIKKIDTKDTINNNIKDSVLPNENNNLRREDSGTLSISHIVQMSPRQQSSSEIEVLSSAVIQTGTIPGSITSRSEAEITQEIFTTSTGEENKTESTTVIEHVYKKSEEYLDIHLTFTYAIMWGIILVMWVPYVLLSFLDIFGNVSIWGGWYTVAVPVTHMSYVTKPIVYLSHKKVFRKAAYQTLPESVKTRTQKVRKVLKSTVNKMDDFIFLQRTNDTANIDETKVKQTERFEMKTFRTKGQDSSNSTHTTVF